MPKLWSCLRLGLRRSVAETGTAEGGVMGMFCHRCHRRVRSKKERRCVCGSVAYFQSKTPEDGYLPKSIVGLGEKDQQRRDDIDALLRLGARVRGWEGLTARRPQKPLVRHSR